MEARWHVEPHHAHHGVRRCRARHPWQYAEHRDAPGSAVEEDGRLLGGGAGHDAQGEAQLKAPWPYFKQICIVYYYTILNILYYIISLYYVILLYYSF